MSGEEVDNIVLEQLRGLRNDIAEFRTEAKDRLTRLELRIGVIEHRLSAIESRLAGTEEFNQVRLDRIERRLELTD